MLARESKFVEPIQLDVVSEKDLLIQVDDYLKTPGAADSTAANVK